MLRNHGFYLSILVAVVLVLGGWAGKARVFAEPTLQIYLEGGLYDTVTQSWYLAPPGSSAGAPFRLWIIGNTSQGPIEEVRLSMAYSAVYRANGVDLAVTITPSTTGGLFGFTDPSTPPPPTFLQYGAEGNRPVLGDGSPLPAHGIYGEGVVWQEWLLGDFTLSDSPIGDFINSVPPPGPKTGQINVYEVTITFSDGSSAHGVNVHFDAYNHVEAKNHVRYRFAPFSHDADGDVTVVPEPGSLVALASFLGGSLVFGTGTFFRRRKKG